MKIPFFINLKQRHNKNTTINLVSGFTIIEALVAIFILSVSVVSMLGVTSSSISSARYANNEITVNYLLQEAIDSVRNSRDTIAFQNKEDALNGGWDNFLLRYGYPSDKCFSDAGCYLETENFNPESVTGTDVKLCKELVTEDNLLGCPFLSYDSTLSSSIFYLYRVNDPSPSIFSRKVKMVINPDNHDEVYVTAYVSWNNGNGTNSKTQELKVSLLNWINE